jgi:DNA-binding transcriptional LysR family regulator
VLTPKISTYHALVTTLFAQQGLPLPARFVEADDETVITNLVASGVGASLLREESALELERARAAKIWGGARVTSTLWFVALAARREDPLIKATFALVRDSWQSEPANDRLAIA